jgi:hypothetical protein
MRTRIRLGLGLAAVVATVFIAGYTLAASVAPATFVPAGTTRYAMVSRGDTATTTSTSWVAIPGLLTDITVPAGKVANVIVTFSG